MLSNLGNICAARFIASVTMLGVSVTLVTFPAAADSERGSRVEVKRQPPRAAMALEKLALFSKSFVSDGFFDENGSAKGKLPVVDVTEVKDPNSSLPPKTAPGPVFVSEGAARHILPPNETPKTRLNDDAPGPFVAMFDAYQRGDTAVAEQYADQWVRYQMNFFFDVRSVTQLIGEALIRQRVIAEDDWDGVQQLIDYEFAKTRKENGVFLKPQYEHAMELVKPDPQHQIEIYYFFSMNCSWCRRMAPEVERLWRSVQQDKNVKMVGMMITPTTQEFLREYRDYTGLTLPVFDGEAAAKAFDIRFVPATIIVTPGNKKAFLKTGHQEFPHLYEFARRAQGLPYEMTDDLRRLAEAPIGQLDQLRAGLPGGQRGIVQASDVGRQLPVATPMLNRVRTVERFELGKF